MNEELTPAPQEELTDQQATSKASIAKRVLIGAGVVGAGVAGIAQVGDEGKTPVRSDKPAIEVTTTQVAEQPGNLIVIEVPTTETTRTSSSMTTTTQETVVGDYLDPSGTMHSGDPIPASETAPEDEIVVGDELIQNPDGTTTMRSGGPIPQNPEGEIVVGDELIQNPDGTTTMRSGGPIAG